MRINLKMKACCRRSRMMLDESVLYGQSGFQCWQSFCMCVNDAMHRAAPSRVPWWGTANLSCSVRPHSPARSSTKRKVSQRSQFVRLNPAWRRLSNPLSLSSSSTPASSQRSARVQRDPGRCFPSLGFQVRMLKMMTGAGQRTSAVPYSISIGGFFSPFLSFFFLLFFTAWYCWAVCQIRFPPSFHSLPL